MKSEPLLTANFLLSTGFHKIKPEWKFFVLGSMDLLDQPEKRSLGDEKHDSCSTYLPMTQSEIWVSRPCILTTEPGYTPTCMMTKSPWAIVRCWKGSSEILYGRQRCRLKKTRSQ